MFHFPKMAGADGKDSMPHTAASHSDSSRVWSRTRCAGRPHLPLILLASNEDEGQVPLRALQGRANPQAIAPRHVEDQHQTIRQAERERRVEGFKEGIAAFEDPAGPGLVLEDRRQPAFGITLASPPHLHLVLAQPCRGFLILQTIRGQ